MDHNDLSPAEIASLLGAARCPQLTKPPFQRSLGETYRQLADHLPAGLARLLGDDLHLRWRGSTTISYGEFVLRHTAQPRLLRATTAPDLGPLFLDVPPPFLGLLVARMLGNRASRTREDFQPASQIEQRLAGQACRQIAAAFCQMWREILPVHLADLQPQQHPLPPREMAADTPLVVLRYGCRREENELVLRWIFPQGWPVRVIHTAVAPYCPAGAASASGLAHPPPAGPHEIVAQLAETRVPTAKLVELQVGDILHTGKDVDQPLTVRVDGVPRFLAHLGKVAQRKAIEIVQVLDPQTPPTADSPHPADGSASAPPAAGPHRPA